MNLKAKFQEIKAFILDVDGVLTDGMVLTLPDGDQVRNMNIKDGYALQHAIKQGYPIVIISGGTSESVRKRLNGLGIKDVHLACKNKLDVFKKVMIDHDLEAEEIAYMGDDIPDYKVMKLVGLACCPKNAAKEIIGISDYVSPYKGGEGCVRDVLEQILSLHGNWFGEDSHEW